MTTHEKSMAAAREAWIASDVSTRFFSDVEHCALEAAITAYISTAITGEVAELVRRVESETSIRQMALAKEITTALTSLAARVEALEAGLGDLLHLNDNHSVFGGEYYHDRIDRTWEAARALLKKDSKA